jgi:hypothetical protein
VKTKETEVLETRRSKWQKKKRGKKRENNLIFNLIPPNKTTSVDRITTTLITSLPHSILDWAGVSNNLKS